MNVYNELAEVNDLIQRSSQATDDILDLYKLYPNECTKLLKELCKINKELEDLEKEFETLQNDIY